MGGVNCAWCAAEDAAQQVADVEGIVVTADAATQTEAIVVGTIVQPPARPPPRIVWVPGQGVANVLSPESSPLRRPRWM